MSSGNLPKRLKLTLVVLGGAVSLLYSLFIAKAVFAWALIVGPSAFMYLLWRLVRAVERVAENLEALESTDDVASVAD